MYKAYCSDDYFKHSFLSCLEAKILRLIFGFSTVPPCSLFDRLHPADLDLNIEPLYNSRGKMLIRPHLQTPKGMRGAWNV